MVMKSDLYAKERYEQAFSYKIKLIDEEIERVKAVNIGTSSECSGPFKRKWKH